VDNILQITNLNFEIKSNYILKDISFSIQPGTIVGIIGPNGSGKTSLFNCISGFNQSTSGTINFNSKSITATSPYERAQLGIGRVFQNFGIFREMTVLDNILVALESKKNSLASFLPWSLSTKNLRQESLEYLKQVNLDSKASHLASSLSGGQMRLLEIIRTLSYGAELFLLDEPTAGVSPKMKDDVANIIIKLKSLGKTVLIIEHDMNFIQRFCERVIVLDGGQIVMDNKPDLVRNDPRLQEIYFGTSSITISS
jgi:branched-chain amino acid transport system ATP-binding protein